MTNNAPESLPPEIRQLPASAQDIFRAAYSEAYSSLDTPEPMRHGCSYAVAWAAVKNRYGREGERWVDKSQILSSEGQFEITGAGSNSHALVIEGPLVEIGASNLNGWGVPEAEVPNLLQTLSGVPLRKCSGTACILDEHACDYNWNPKDDIGEVMAGFVRDGWIWGRAEVTDPIAISKVASGTWKPNWSIFLAHASEDDNGMIAGAITLSVTLVNNPAYPGAGFSVPSGAGAANSNQRGTGMTGEKTYTKAELDAAIQEAVKAATEGTVSKEDLDAATAEAAKKATEGMLSEEDVQKRIDEAIKAQGGQGAPTGGEGEPAGVPEGMVSKTEVETMISAAVEQAVKNTQESLERQTLATEVAEMQASAGLIKAEDKGKVATELAAKSASELRSTKDLLSKMNDALKSAGEAAVNKFKETNLQFGGAGAGGEGPKFTVGRPDKNGNFTAE